MNKLPKCPYMRPWKDYITDEHKRKISVYSCTAKNISRVVEREMLKHCKDCKERPT